MPEIPDQHRFEPDKFALKLWMYTRKEDKAYGMNDTPGFFSTHDFPKDQGFFITALILELVGMVLLIYNGFTLGDSQFALIAIIGAIGLTIGDLFLAYLLHRNEEKRCVARNRKKASTDPGEKAVIEDDLKSGRIGSVFIGSGIVLIAIIKFLGIVLLGTFDHLAIFIALLILFLFVVYVHFRHTGYFIYAWLTKKAFKKQLGFLNRGDTKFAARNWTHYFESDVNLLDGLNGQEEIVANQNHKITLAERKETQDKKFAYNIHSKGILSDRDITNFTQNLSFNNDQIMIIASECLRLQIKQYNSKT